MLVGELKTGDLIFELDSMRTAEHVSMYAGEREGLHYQVHATVGRYKSIMITYLPEGDYEVIRSKDNHLALLATGIMYRWVEHQVKFAEVKHNHLLSTLEDLRGIDLPNAAVIQKQFGKSKYNTTSIDLYINMSKALPYVPLIAGERMELFCSEAIIAAFNMALMISHEELIQRLSETPTSLPLSSILETMIRQLDNPLPFDASSTWPGGMYQHCIEDVSHWDNLGTLSHNEDLQTALSDQKAEWLEFRRVLLEDAPAHVEQYMHLERAATPSADLLDLEYQSESPISADRSSQHLLLWAGLQKTPCSSPVLFRGQNDLDNGQACAGSPNRRSPQNLLLWGQGPEIPRSSPVFFLGQTDAGSPKSASASASAAAAP